MISFLHPEPRFRDPIPEARGGLTNFLLILFGTRTIYLVIETMILIFGPLLCVIIVVVIDDVVDYL